MCEGDLTILVALPVTIPDLAGRLAAIAARTTTAFDPASIPVIRTREMPDLVPMPAWTSMTGGLLLKVKTLHSASMPAHRVSLHPQHTSVPWDR